MRYLSEYQAIVILTSWGCLPWKGVVDLEMPDGVLNFVNKCQSAGGLPFLRFPMTQADLAATGQPVPQSVSVVRVTCRWCHWCPPRCSPARVENFSPVFKFGTHHGLVTVGPWASTLGAMWPRQLWFVVCYLFGRPSLESGHQTSLQCDAQMTQMPRRVRDNVGGGKSKNPATFLRIVKWKSIISCGFSLCFLGTWRSSRDGELCRGALPKMEKRSVRNSGCRPTDHWSYSPGNESISHLLDEESTIFPATFKGDMWSFPGG